MFNRPIKSFLVFNDDPVAVIAQDKDNYLVRNATYFIKKTSHFTDISRKLQWACPIREYAILCTYPTLRIKLLETLFFFDYLISYRKILSLDLDIIHIVGTKSYVQK